MLSIVRDGKLLELSSSELAARIAEDIAERKETAVAREARVRDLELAVGELARRAAAIPDDTL